MTWGNLKNHNFLKKKKAKQNTKRKAITRKRMKEKQQLEGIEDAIEIEKLER